MKRKTIVYSAVILVCAVFVYRHLITGGWLNHHYQFTDPNVVNLLLAIFEPIAVLAVIAYWIWRTDALDRSLFVLFVLQLLIGIGFFTFLMFFFFTWTPKMM